ncbi:hypothetical protein CKA38_09890 [Ereboglobus luteus]|uniref:ATPase n=1 Tax=Ereboglobus luteus TaxID=1796921 RepID=A0A2U8E3P4_9BACT|nr:hypothetical protein CKA38_09890 [Ereboglobus luteus]
MEAFCFKELTVRDEELVCLAGIVAFADRLVRRKASLGWSRNLEIVMPVAEPRFWQQPEIVDTLLEALRYLTGDAWRFKFIKRAGRLPRVRQAEMDLGQGEFQVIPFSNGMDSFAQSRLLRKERPHISPIRVTAWNHGLAGSRTWLTDADGTRYRRVAVPIKFSFKGNADQTYRTRGFLFSVLAGLAAHMSGAKSIVIPEAGQGALGPSLVPVGAESPHRGSHPGFSRRMAAFFRAFWQKTISFEHPQLWHTKGEVLTMLKKENLHEGWEKTFSCSRGQRDIRTERHKKIHCGICSGCMLRRLAVFSADLPEPADTYMWPDLSASSLEESLCEDARRPVSTNDWDIAVHAVMAMEDLARLANTPITHPKMENALFDAFGNNPQQLAGGAEPLRRLLLAHQTEWRKFTQQLGPESWVNQQIAHL